MHRLLFSRGSGEGGYLKQSFEFRNDRHSTFKQLDPHAPLPLLQNIWLMSVLQFVNLCLLLFDAYVQFIPRLWIYW